MGNVAAVFFDFGGVYYSEGFREGLFSIARGLGLPEETFFRQAEEAVFTSGYLTGRAPEKAFWADLAARSGTHADLYPQRETILAAFQLHPMMRTLVRRVRCLVPVGLLTDQTNWLYELDERDGFFGEFDEVISSFEEGASKRDLEIFRIACERLDVPPENLLFYDDNPGNVERASAFGFLAHLFIGPEETEESLAESGLDLPPGGEKEGEEGDEGAGEGPGDEE